MYDDTAEILKPTIDAQKSIKESVDKKQDEVIDQLRSNQLAITQGKERYQGCNTRCYHT